MNNYSTNDVVGIAKMIDEVIVTSEGKYISIIEVNPINFRYRSKSEQERIIQYFANFLRVAPFKFRIKSLSRRADVNKFLEILRTDFQKETNPVIKRYQQDYLRLIRNIGTHEGIERQFFIIIEFVQTDSMIVNDEYDIVEYLRQYKRKTAKFLRNCGNEVVNHPDERAFALETVFRLLNQNKDEEEIWYDYEENKEKLIKLYDNDEEKMLEMPDYYSYLCAPDSIRYYRDYCVIDDVYYTFLMFRSDDYPDDVPASWLSFLFNYDIGIDVDIFIEKKPASAIKSKLRQRERINTGRINTMRNDNGENAEAIVTSLNAIRYLRNALYNDQDFFYVSTLITISANSPEELVRKQNSLKDALESVNIDAVELPYQINSALNAYLPTHWIDSKIWNKSKRNMTTEGLSAFYPFSSFEVSDDNGILLGVSQDNNSLVVSDCFNKKKYSNANAVLIGTSGSGKTFSLQTMCMRYRLKGTQIFAIIPEKCDEWYPACKAIGGTYINISSGSASRINVMEIRVSKTILENMEKGADHRQAGMMLLNRKIESLSTFFSLIIPDMNATEKSLLDEALQTTYREKGITSDNNSLIDHYETKVVDGIAKRVPVIKTMPVLGDLYEVLKRSKLTERLALIVNKYVNGSAKSFNGQTNVNLDNKYVLIDLTDLKDEYKPIGMFIALECVWDKVREDRISKSIIAIEEVWKLINENELAARYVEEIYRLIRGYAGAAFCATQEVSDFFALKDGKYGKAIINNSKLKMLFNVDEDQIDTLQEIFKLSDEEKNAILRFDRGQVLVKSNSNTFAVNYLASRFESDLVNSNSDVLERIQREKEAAKKQS